jgi:biopolymer transport protein ExbD
VQVDSGFGRKRARIEMIALIDVVFLLLVFFIYAMLSMTVFRGLELNLPRAEGETQREAIVVTLDRENRLTAEGREMQPGEVVTWAMSEQARTNLPLLIRGDREADFGVALELLAELQAAGLEAVSFQVENTPRSAPESAREVIPGGTP